VQICVGGALRNFLCTTVVPISFLSGGGFRGGGGFVPTSSGASTLHGMLTVES